MVTFTESVRKKCRKCQDYMPSPTSNEREAFCCRGCYEQWYRKRCRVCECQIEQSRGPQRIICKRLACKSAWKQRVVFGRFLKVKTPFPSHTPSNATIGSETLDFIDPKSASESTRGWRMMAGPELSPTTLHAASLPDGPKGEWAGGQYQGTEARNQAMLEEFREGRYVALVRAGPPQPRLGVPVSPIDIGPGLDIPDFLRRIDPALVTLAPEETARFHVQCGVA